MNVRPRTVLQRIREAVESGLLAALLVLLVGGLGWWLDQPWLFSSLAPSIYLHVLTPERAGARPFPTFFGHLLGLVVGLLAVNLTGSIDAPPVEMGGAPGVSRLWAAVLAVGGIVAVVRTVRISNPAASATALLVALGSITADVKGAVAVVIAAALVAGAGEAVRRVVLRRRDLSLT